MIKVSIIIPCYNYGWLLSETLESVLSQSFVNWECIVIDDGSSDNTSEISKLYAEKDSRILYLYQANAGMSSARNRGLEIATGHYIQFLDADDLLTAHKLSKQVAYVQQHPDVDIIYGDMRYFKHENPEVLGLDFNMGNTDWMLPMYGSGMPVLEALIKGNTLPINAALTSARIVDKAGGFDESLRSMEDWEFWLRCTLAGAVFHYDPDPEAWVLVRLHPTSTSNNRKLMNNYEQQIRKQIMPTLVSLNAQDAIKANAKALHDFTLAQAIYNVSNGKVWVGLQCFVELAYSTRHYKYYLSSALFWLKKRYLK